MAANSSRGISVTVSTFVLKLVALAVAFILLGYVIAQTQASTDFNGVLVGIFYSLGGLMLIVIGVGVAGDVVNQLRRR
jgi:hypothetical protein